jgi:hypothetical protein
MTANNRCLLRQDPDNPDLLYNQGLCYVDLGQLNQGIDLLHRCLQLAPPHSHACVALALGYQRASDLPQAKKSTIPRLLPQKHFQAVLDMPAPKELRGLARDGLSKIARELKARGLRMDGSLLSGWAMRLFRGNPLEAGPGYRLRNWDAVAARARQE